jgi:hypothetical protein
VNSRSAFVIDRCAGALQDQPHHLGLPARSRLLEDVREVRARRRQRELQPAGGDLQPLPGEDLQRRHRLGTREAELVAQVIAADDDIAFGSLTNRMADGW